MVYSSSSSNRGHSNNKGCAGLKHCSDWAHLALFGLKEVKLGRKKVLKEFIGIYSRDRFIDFSLCYYWFHKIHSRGGQRKKAHGCSKTGSTEKTKVREMGKNTASLLERQEQNSAMKREGSRCWDNRHVWKHRLSGREGSLRRHHPTVLERAGIHIDWVFSSKSTVMILKN